MNNNFSLQKALDEYLSEQQAFKPQDAFWISDMGRCMRMRILKRMGKEQLPVDPRSLRIFAIGKMNHAFFQDILAKGNYLLEKEIPCAWEDYELRGRADALVQTQDNGLLLYEFKNTHSRKILYKEVDKHYILQGLTYLLRLNREYQNAIKQLRICLISRDDLIIKETGHFLTDEWLNEITGELKQLKEWWAKKDSGLPPEMENGAWQCKYCSLINYCPNKCNAPTAKKP